MNKIQLKSEQEIDIMVEGGKKLGEVKKRLAPLIQAGVNAWEIEQAACDIINELGAFPSFKKVPGYKWATCVNVNDGVVHGIPKKETVFKEEDVVSVDVGVFYEGFHTDSALSVQIGKSESEFLRIGKETLNKGIAQAKVGKSIWDISSAIEDSLSKAGLTPVYSLTGHGVGKELHEQPLIPCFAANNSLKKIKIVEGMVLAIEIMYTKGNGDIVLDNDGWTIRTKDGKISALFEDTVAVRNNGTFILTR